MKCVLPIFLLFFNTFCLKAQPSIEWQKSFGGTEFDDAHSMQKTIDGGYVVAGWSASNDGDITGHHGPIGGRDFWIVKLDSIGTIQWEKSLGGTVHDEAKSIQQTADSGFIVAGWSGSNDGDVTGNHGAYDYWIVKLNNAGTLQWQKSFGGSANDIALSIRQTFDGGYVVAGYSNSINGDVTDNNGLYDCWILKLDSIGIIQWQKSLGGSDFEDALSILQTTDSGYIFVGSSFSNDSDVTANHGRRDVWIVKLNDSGNIQWQKSFGGSENDAASSVQQTHDGGFILAGYTESTDGDVIGAHGIYGDYWILKLNAEGNLQWQKACGGTGRDEAVSIIETPDSGYVIAGRTNSIDGDVTGNHNGTGENWIVKIDSAGTIQWEKCYGGSSNDEGHSILVTNDNGYIVAGFSLSNDGDVTVNHGYWDYWIIKLRPVVLSMNESKKYLSDINVRPNPVTMSTVISFSIFQTENISVKIYEMTGRFVKNIFEGNVYPGDHQIKLNLATGQGVDDGIYLLNFSGNSFLQSFKLVIAN